MSDWLQRFSRHFRVTLSIVGQQGDNRVIGFGVAVVVDVNTMTLNTCINSNSNSYCQWLLLDCGR